MKFLSIVEEAPIHEIPGFDVTETLWIACSQPERPVDSFVHFDIRCAACRMKMRVEIERGNDVWLGDFWTRGNRPISEMLTLYEESL